MHEIKETLSNVLTPDDLERAIPLIEEIQQLKKDKKAIILGHNYMTPEVYYGVSDILGDSLGLSKEAAQVDADIILFNGVYFMAETAKVLNPGKKVLIPDAGAGCSLVEDITAQDVRDLKAKYPGAPVVTYVNSSAAVKAETDICCTSANALRVVESLKEDTVIFIPDRFLAANVALKTSKTIIPWEKGRCIVHEQYSAADIESVRKNVDDLLVIAHPECNTDVTAAADFTGSTSQMEMYIEQSDRKNIFLVTECSMTANLRAKYTDRHFITLCQNCPYMKMITLEKVLHSLKTETVEVFVPEEIRLRAKASVDRMLAL